MTGKIFALVPVMVPTLGTAMALTQPTMRLYAQFGKASLMYRNALCGAYGQGGAMAVNAAFVGGGSAPDYCQKESTRETGYSAGNGIARVSAAL